MSMAERNHHKKGESRAHSLAHKYDDKKPATVIGHLFYERHHGYESTKRRGKQVE